MGNSISYVESDCYAHLSADAGSIKGVQYENKARRFAGIPYAQPPTGTLRWRKPQPLPKSFSYKSTTGEPFDATNFRSVCPQTDYSKTVSEHLPKHTYDEDCLRLNIWTPCPSPDTPNPKWPVMVWFHGGWFQVGDPSQEEGMSPVELISTAGLNAIFVAVGYRLNVFGFLAGDALREESNGQEVGNYGLWDQRLAMDWVYDNIAAFGGDPDNIILSGRSAGAYSVQAQVLYDFRGDMPDASRDKFRRLVMYSNAIPTQPKTVEDCQPQFDELVKYFNIPSFISGTEKLTLLRQVSTQNLCRALTKLEHHTFRPVTDEIFIHSGIFECLSCGAFAAEFKRRKLQLLIGEVRDEDTLYAVTNGPEANARSFALQVSNYYSPTTTTRLLQHYQLPESTERSDWTKQFGNIIADGQVRAPSRYLVDNLITNGVDIEDVWRYHIALRLSFITEEMAPASFGVSHAMDKPIWNYSILHSPTAVEQKIMHEWIQNLVAFIQHDKTFKFGTSGPEEYKVLTSDGKIEIQRDERWQDLIELMDVFIAPHPIACQPQ